jgi:uncharacterized protein YqhQ
MRKLLGYFFLWLFLTMIISIGVFILVSIVSLFIKVITPIYWGSLLVSSLVSFVIIITGDIEFIIKDK